MSYLIGLFNWLGSKKIFLLIVLIGFIVYINSLFNSFAFDDFPQIVNNTYVHSLGYVYKIFSGSTFNYGSSGELSGAYYKPIMSTFFAIIYTIFGEKAFFFHLLQLILHISNSTFVYLILKSFIRKNLSFFLALIFLVHPLNVEAVSYISALQDVLYFFFGMIVFFIVKRNHLTVAGKILAVTFMILSVLSKETGFLFLPLIFIYQSLFDKKNLRTFVFLSVIPIGVYLFFRLIIARISFQTPQLAPITFFNLGERLLNVPYIISFYLKSFIFPINLTSVHFEAYKSIDFPNFFLPLIIVLIFSTAVFLSGVSLLRKNEKQINYFLFFLLWFLLGIGLHLQIFPLDLTVADRWFYFPMVGLLGMIGIFISNVKVHNKSLFYFGAALLIVIILLFSLRTIIRNSNWRNSMSLYTNDIKNQKDNFQLEALLGYELNREGRLDEAKYYLEKSLKAYSQSPVLNNLGTVYAKKGDINSALIYLKKALAIEEDESIRQNISYILINHKNSSESLSFIEESLRIFPNNPVLWVYLAIVENRMGASDKAQIAAQQCFVLSRNNGCFSYPSYKEKKI